MMIVLGIALGVVGFIMGFITKKHFSDETLARTYLLGYQHAMMGNVEMLELVPVTIRKAYGLMFKDEIPECQTNNDKTTLN